MVEIPAFAKARAAEYACQCAVDWPMQLAMKNLLRLLVGALSFVAVAVSVEAQQPNTNPQANSAPTATAIPSGDTKAKTAVEKRTERWKKMQQNQQARKDAELKRKAAGSQQTNAALKKNQSNAAKLKSDFEKAKAANAAKATVPTTATAQPTAAPQQQAATAVTATAQPTAAPQQQTATAVTATATSPLPASAVQPATMQQSQAPTGTSSQTLGSLLQFGNTPTPQPTP